MRTVHKISGTVATGVLFIPPYCSHGTVPSMPIYTPPPQFILIKTGRRVSDAGKPFHCPLPYHQIAGMDFS